MTNLYANYKVKFYTPTYHKKVTSIDFLPQTLENYILFV